MPEEFDEEVEKDPEIKGPIHMDLVLSFRNERTKEIQCKYNTATDAQRTIQILNQAKQHMVPSSNVMLDDADGNVHLIDMLEVQHVFIRVRNK